MKLPELKNKFKSKYAIRIIAGALVVTLVGTGVSVYDVSAAKGSGAAKAAVEETVAEETEEAEEADNEEALNDMLSSSLKVNEKEIGKEETVYIIADNTGKADSVIVSDHLINNDDKATIEDASTLTDIKNVKGDETFTQNGKKLVWQADGSDIYYQGTGKDTTPVTQKLTYFLDGKEITPEELAGKSGKVTIRFDYTNNEKVEATVNGKKEEVCVPFVALSGMVLDDSFKDIEVTNGRVVADGNKSVVFGYALPGLKDSLKVNEKDFDGDISIPDYFEVSAQVENFSLDMTMTVAMNATNFVSTEGGDEESSLNDLMDELTDATSQLEDGSGALAEGVDTLKSNLGEFKNGVNTLADGVATLKNGAGSLADGANTLNSSAKSISDGIAMLDNTLKTPLTDQEKAAYSKQAVDMVNANFAPGSDGYNMVYGLAKKSFEDSMSGSTDMIYKSLRYNPDGSDGALYTNLFQAGYAQKYMELVEAGMQKGITDYCTATSKVPDALTMAEYNQIKTQVTAQVDAAAGQIAAGVQPVVEASLQQLAAGITGGMASQGADATAKSVVSACQTASAQAASQALVTGIETTKSQIAASIEAKQDNGYSLVTGAAALSQGTSELAGKVPELVNGVNALNDGAGKLKDGTSQIVDGVDQLSDGAHQLADGIVTFNEEGINKIVNSYNGDIEPLMDRLQAVLDAGADYQSYTDIADGVNGSVKFIYKTAAVK